MYRFPQPSVSLCLETEVFVLLSHYEVTAVDHKHQIHYHEVHVIHPIHGPLFGRFHKVYSTAHPTHLRLPAKFSIKKFKPQHRPDVAPQ